MEKQNKSIDRALIARSLLIGFAATYVLFFFVNVVIDWKLKSNFDDLFITKTNKANPEEKTLMNDIKNKLKDISGLEPGLNKQEIIWRSLCLYHSPGDTGWMKAGWIMGVLPVTEHTAVGLNDLKDIFKQYKVDYDNGNKNKLDDLFRYISPLLTELGNDSWFRLRRYLNGGIQFLTIWLALAGLLQILFLFDKIRNEKKFFKEPLRFLTPLADNSPLNEGVELFPTGQDGKLKKSDANSYLGKLIPVEDSLKEKNIFFAAFQSMLAALRNFSATGNKENALGYFKTSFEQFRDEAASRWEMIRYITWAVPSIGFIGTVIGIGDALGNAHKVIESGAGTGSTQQVGAVQMITASLGTAFDTTLIALFCSILLMLFFHLGTRYEDKILTTIYNDIDKEVIQRFHGQDMETLFTAMMEEPMENMVKVFRKIWSRTEVDKLETVLSRLKETIKD